MAQKRPEEAIKVSTDSLARNPGVSSFHCFHSEDLTIPFQQLLIVFLGLVISRNQFPNSFLFFPSVLFHLCSTILS